MAGTLLTTAVITMVPYAYADDGNENEAEDSSIAQLNDCDENLFEEDPDFENVCSNTAPSLE
jgi:hypothetical protein